MPAATTSHATASEFQRKAARADLLAGQADAASDPLSFVAILCRAQGSLATAITELHGVRPLTGHLEDDDLARVLPLHKSFLHVVADKGPEQLSEEARTRGAEMETTARSRLLVYWKGGLSAREDYLSRALLRPYAEVLRAHSISIDREKRRGHCPFCGAAAIISARRAAPDADGGLRLLSCGLCGEQWNFNRSCCPSCFEEDPYKLPVFRSEAHPAVIIEACETCRRYLKAIDLTRDARPIPEIDDVVSIAMDLWAVSESYQRIEPGLAGV